MRGLPIAIMLASLLALAPTCQQSQREEGTSQVIVSDIPCRQVWEKIQQELTRMAIPVAGANAEEGWIETAPVSRDPLPGDPYVRVEEQYRIEVKCREPLTTRITGRPRVMGVKPDSSRVPLGDAGRYWERFLENLKIR